MSNDLPYHPLAEIFPLMEDAEFEELVADIKTNKLQESIWVYQNRILDGRNRYRACLKLSIEPRLIQFLGDEKAARAFVYSKNICRRHLTAEDKRKAIAELIKAEPERSDRQIAEIAKVSPTFVGKVRTEKEATGDVSTVDTRTDTKGRKQPAKKKKKRNELSMITDDETGKQRRATKAEMVKFNAALMRDFERYGPCATQTALFINEPDGTERPATPVERVAWLEANRIAEKLIDAAPEVAHELPAILKDDGIVRVLRYVLDGWLEQEKRERTAERGGEQQIDLEDCIAERDRREGGPPNAGSTPEGMPAPTG